MKDIKDTVKSKGGIIVKEAKDLFDKYMIQCKNGHTFELYLNDISMGQWCDQCLDVLDTILNTLNIPFKKDVKIGKFQYPFSINMNERNYVIFDTKDNRPKLTTNAKENGFNVIIIDDYSVKDLNKIIWNTIKENKEFIVIDNVKKEEIIETCTLLKTLGNEKEDSGSIVKYAESCPQDVNRCIGYIRVSTTMQVQDGFSLDAQESKIYNECKNRNLYCKALYIDKGLSGGSMEKRLALQEMMKSLKKGDWIMCSSVSRLARDTADLLSMLKTIESKECHLVVMDLNLDLTTPAGKLILTFFGSQAQFERELTSERVKTVMHHLKDNGLLRTKPLFGWKMNPNQAKDEPIHVRDEKEQEIIKRIRTFRNKHKKLGITEFTRLVNSKSGIPPPRKSKAWYHKALGDLMKREGIN
tara:strand:- start:1830 stop:3068 length:1239 start_codon:yes stop_codon:yes gene_type:complete